MTSPLAPLRTLIAIAVSLLLAATALSVLLLNQTSAPARAAGNPVTPGNFTGRGFDQCNAPTQRAMDAWLQKSPYRAAGIYISGASRFCREQPNLTPAWVRTQLAKGWRLLPITLGPQPSCLSRFPRYGKNIDPTVNPSPANTYAAARTQGAREADTAVAAARRLGIVPRSTLFYDMEGWNINHSTACNNSALWFMSAWSKRLHDLGYASGVYSSAGSGIVLLDRARRAPLGAGYTNPDQLWIARWDGVANTSTSYISDQGWAGQRIKQYRGGHNETYGGVTINIDSNYLSVRTPAIGTVPAPSAPPAPALPPRTTGTYDQACTRAAINQRAYRLTDVDSHTYLTTSLQCLLKQRRLYNYKVTGRWNAPTQAAVRAYQRQVGLNQYNAANRRTWIALTSAGSNTPLGPRMRGPHVIRAQRALNAATSHGLPITGYMGVKTRAAVKTYQRNVGLKPTGNVNRATWRKLHLGRW